MRQRSAVDFHEWLIRSAGMSMDIAGEDFLSDSGFAKNQNRYVGFGDLPGDLANSDHLQVFSADSQFLIIGFGQLTPKGLNFIAEP
jgi:hypothetical protein